MPAAWQRLQRAALHGGGGGCLTMRCSAYFGLEPEFGSEVKLEALWLTSLFKLLCAVQSMNKMFTVQCMGRGVLGAM